LFTGQGRNLQTGTSKYNIYIKPAILLFFIDTIFLRLRFIMNKHFGEQSLLQQPMMIVSISGFSFQMPVQQKHSIFSLQ